MIDEPLEQIYEERWTESELSRVRDVWNVLVRDYFQKLVPADAAVLDVGCGFCHFLNAVVAKEKVGADGNPASVRFAAPDVRVQVVSDLSLKEFTENHFDLIFVSNVLEHLENSRRVVDLIARCKQLLSKRGRLVILQPNFRLTGPRYFDFIDHKTILTDASVREALNLAGLELEREVVRFLPYTTKGKLPVNPALVALYLRLKPFWWLFGKQSLFIARLPR